MNSRGIDQEGGRVVSDDRAGHEPSHCVSRPSGDHPSRGCVETAGVVIAVYLVLAAISHFVSIAAGFWFGLGALVACVIALWEAGRNAQAIEARQGGDGVVGSVHESASPEGVRP